MLQLMLFLNVIEWFFSNLIINPQQEFFSTDIKQTYAKSEKHASCELNYDPKYAVADM